MMSNWISVEDRLPEGTAWVLVHGGGTINCMGYSKGEFKDWTDASAFNVATVTHWMPLPSPPAEQSEL